MSGNPDAPAFPSQLRALADFSFKDADGSNEDEYQKAWFHQVGLNGTRGYGGRCMTYAADWAWLAESEIDKNSSKADGEGFDELMQKCERVCDYDGLTGFMYGAAVGMLAKYWLYGDKLRVWHNAKYGVPADKKGTVNPAILTIGASDE